ncbi:MAG: hypothetical protein IH830_13245 [Planctomycetes bacterium]|nr:hypothetical protein [Planctomycetota bacterium]
MRKPDRMGKNPSVIPVRQVNALADADLSDSVLWVAAEGQRTGKEPVGGAPTQSILAQRSIGADPCSSPILAR